MAISKYNKKFEYGKILTEGDLNGMVDAINLSIDGVNNADSKSETAIKEATIAKNAVKTLEGLANSTEAMETLAGQVVQIEENKKDIEELYRLCTSEDVIKEQSVNAGQWLMYRTPVSANVPLYFHFESTGEACQVLAATSNGSSYTNVEYFVGGTNYITVDGEVWFEFIPTKDADGIRVFVKDNPCKVMQYNRVPLKGLVGDVKKLTDLMTIPMKFASVEIPNGWTFPKMEVTVGETYIFRISNAESGKTFNIYTVLSSSLTTIVEKVLETTLTSGSREVVFTPTKDADNLRIYYNGSSPATLDAYINKIGVAELGVMIEENQKNIVATNERIDPLFKEYAGGADVPSGWSYPYVEAKAGEKYILSVQNAESGKTFNAYTVTSDSLTTNIDRIIETTLKSGSLSVEFTATKDADRLKIYYNGDSAEILLTKISSNISVEISRLSKENEKRIYTLEDASQPYRGKKILSLGDSYTWMNYYGTFLAEVTGCEQRGRGQNGAPIRYFANDSYTGADGGSVAELFDKTLLDQYDIITIMGGTNNYGQGQAVGSINDEAGAGSLFGDLKTLLNKIISIDPEKKIFFCTQPYRYPNPSFHNGLGGHTPNSGGATLEDMANAIVEFAEHYGYPCYDFYHESGWNEFTNRVINPDAEYPYRPFDGNKYTLDGLHPRNGIGNGAYQLGRNFGEFINRHFLL